MNVSYFRNKYEYICSVSPSMSPGSLKQVEAPSPGPVGQDQAPLSMCKVHAVN